MSDGKKKPSGAEFRKRTREKEKILQEQLSRTPKLDHFFQKSQNNLKNNDARPPTHSPNPVDNCHLGSDDAGNLSSTVDGFDHLKVIEQEVEVVPRSNNNDSVFFHKSPNKLNKNDVCASEPATVNNSSLHTIPKILVDHCHSISGEENSSGKDGVGHLKEVEQRAEVVLYPFNNDPAFWEKDEKTRDFVALNGFNQNKHCNFSNSKRSARNGFRYFSPNLFTRKHLNGEEKLRGWLVYSESTGNVYCAPCFLFGSDSSQFANEGFSDWKNASSRIESHEKSVAHKTCEIKLKERANVVNRVDKSLVTQLENEVSYWKKVLIRVVAAVKSLAIRGLAFRGSDEKFGSSRNGNYLMLLELIAEFDPFLACHIEKYDNKGSGHVSYLSKTVCEEVIQIMASKNKKVICIEMKKAKYYSIVIDSTPDISHVDQLSYVARYVQNRKTPVERFLKFVDHVGHKAVEMFEATLEVLNSYELDVADCRGQSYDNAPNMSGVYSGLQARLRAENDLIDWIPCSAHSINLVGNSAATSCQEACFFFDIVNHLYAFFAASNTRWEILQNCLSKNSRTVKRLSETRWSARHDAVSSLFCSLPEVLAALEKLEVDPDQKPEARCEATGLIKKLHKLETVLMLCIWKVILERLNAVNKVVQTVDVDIEEVCKLFQSLSDFLKTMRDEFDLYETQALELAHIKEYQANVARKRKKTVPFGENRINDTGFTARDDFRINTFCAIVDKLICELQNRGEAYRELYKKFFVLINLKRLNSDEVRENAEKMLALFSGDLEESFVSECLHLKAHCDNANLSSEQMRPRKLLQYLIDSNMEDVFPNVEIASRMYICKPIANATAERSFSVLKRIKSYLRSQISQDRLNSLASLAIESDLTKTIDYNDVISQFAVQKARRVII